MNKPLLKIFPLLLAAGFLFADEGRAQRKTEVLVVGTIHEGHESNPNYSDQDLVNILGTYAPDAVCVEIPPSYFRKRSYLTEMMIASIYGLDHHLKVYPIDWWDTSSDARAQRREYMQTADYKRKEKTADSLVNANAVMQTFIKKYGSMDSIWKNNRMDYRFFNGKDYNDYIREMYTIAVDVYGDGCMNLHSEQRNARMMELINQAIAENRGKRVIVLTGAEHKYYFDIALSKQKGIKLVHLEDILPLKETSQTENMTAFIEKGLARGYYDAADSSAVDAMYGEALVPLIHGMGMDEDPTLIPAENIEKALPIVEEWEKRHPRSVSLQFEQSWIKFLQKDYSDAIGIAKRIAHRLNEIPKESQWFVKTFYWRNLGFCYDMVGQREQAVKAYRECKNTCKELNLNEHFAKGIYKNFENEPYAGKTN